MDPIFPSTSKKVRKTFDLWIQIRLRKSAVRISGSGSGSVSKCHGSTKLVPTCGFRDTGSFSGHCTALSQAGDDWIENILFQVVFSLQLGLGSFSTYASYNKFGHNLIRDALIGRLYTLILFNCKGSHAFIIYILKLMDFAAFICLSAPHFIQNKQVNKIC